MDEQELDAFQRARIASKAQAEAHRALRDAHPDEYAAAYQGAKDQLTRLAQAEARGTT